MTTPITTTHITPRADAADIMARYSQQFLALGAHDVQVLDDTLVPTISLVYNNNFAGVQAAGAIRDTVEGVRILIDNQSRTADYWEATGENVARWLEQSPVVRGVRIGETHPLQLTVVAEHDHEYALADLLRNTLDDGTSVSVPVRYYTQDGDTAAAHPGPDPVKPLDTATTVA